MARHRSVPLVVLAALQFVACSCRTRPERGELDRLILQHLRQPAADDFEGPLSIIVGDEVRHYAELDPASRQATPECPGRWRQVLRVTELSSTFGVRVEVSAVECGAWNANARPFSGFDLGLEAVDGGWRVNALRSWIE